MNSMLSQQQRKEQLEKYKQQKKAQATFQTKSPIQQQKTTTPKPINTVGTVSQFMQDKQRSQLNQTNGNFHSKITASTSNKPTTTTNNIPSHFKIPSKITPAFLQGRGVDPKVSALETEISVIFSLYKKNQELEKAPQQLKITHDHDKWKKKFFLVFNRDKVLDLSQNPAMPLEQKNLSLKPTSLNKIGERLLQHSSKFWVLYLKLVQEKIRNDEQKKTIRELIQNNFKENNSDLQIIFNEVGSIIDLEQPVIENKENELPRFGGADSSNNSEEKEVFNSEQNEISQNEQVNDMTQVTKQENGNKFNNNETFTQYPTPNINNNLSLFQDQPMIETDNSFLVPNRNLIPPPSQEYLVRPPLQMSQVSIMSTPNFQEFKNRMHQNEEGDDDEEMNEDADNSQSNDNDDDHVVQNLQSKLSQNAGDMTFLIPRDQNQEDQENENEDQEAEQFLYENQHQQEEQENGDINMDDDNEDLQEEKQIEDDKNNDNDEQEDEKIQEVEQVEGEQPPEYMFNQDDLKEMGEEEEEEVQQQQDYDSDQVNKDLELQLSLEEKEEDEQNVIVQEVKENEEHIEINQEVQVAQEENQEADSQLEVEQPIEQVQQQQIIEDFQQEQQNEQIIEEEEQANVQEEIHNQQTHDDLILIDQPTLNFKSQLSQQEPLIINQALIDEETMKHEELKHHDSADGFDSKKATKKRKRERSPSVGQNTRMELRSKYKKRRLNEDCQNEETKKPSEITGASFIRYELIEKKGQQKLVPVRYSIRVNNDQLNEKHEHQLERKILNNQIDFEYEPSNIENLFNMDKTTQEIQKLLKNRLQDLEKNDIQKVIQVNEESGFSIIQIKPEVREKYGGQKQIAAALKRLSISPVKREGQMRELMESLLRDKKVREIMFTNASEEAINFIRKM